MNFTSLSEIVQKTSFHYQILINRWTLHESCPNEFFRCIPRLPLNSNTRTRLRKNYLHYPHGIFYYKVMPFGLKNARATYQRMITKMFEQIMRKTMDAYINDIVVKSKKEPDHLKDHTKVFIILKKNTN